MESFLIIGSTGIEFLLILAAIIAWCYVSDQLETKKRAEKERAERELAEEKERAHKLWLTTPAGIAWTESERLRLLEIETDKLKKAETERILREQEELRKAEEVRQLQLKKWKEYHEHKTLLQIKDLSGIEFELLLIRLLKKMGYRDVQGTPASGDHGADIICTDNQGKAVAIQAKKSSKSVGNGAVQELLGGMRKYNCNLGYVITNSTFTRKAVELASVDQNIQIFDGSWLEKQMAHYFPIILPEFNEEEYQKQIASLEQLDISSPKTYRNSSYRSYGRKKQRRKWRRY